MPKLNQIIAIANGKKSQSQKKFGNIYQKLAKFDMLSGLSRTYLPKDEEGDKLPPEETLVKYTVGEAIGKVKETLTGMYNVIATQEIGNTLAKADIVVDGEVIVEDVPVTYMLFLEKQMKDLLTFVGKLPKLDPSERWEFSEETNCYVSKPKETTKTKRVMRNHVKSEATKEHPAQVETYSEDVIIGNWTTTRFSGTITAKEVEIMFSRVRKLQEAIKFAREEANSLLVENSKIGDKVMDYIFP